MVHQRTRKFTTKRGGGKKHRAAPPTPKLEKKKNAKVSPALAADGIRHIAGAHAALKQSKDKWDAAKRTAREAKAQYEKNFEELGRIIGEEVGTEQALYSGPTRATVAADNEEWRTKPLSSLAIPKGTLDKLKEAGIETMGDLTDYTDPAKNGGRQNRLDMIKGIKGGAIERIEAATTAFWADQKKLAEEAANAIEGLADQTKLPPVDAKLNGEDDEDDDESDVEAGDE